MTRAERARSKRDALHGVERPIRRMGEFWWSSDAVENRERERLLRIARRAALAAVRRAAP